MEKNYAKANRGKKLIQICFDSYSINDTRTNLDWIYARSALTHF